MTPKLLGMPARDTFDWHKLRASGIGASESAAVLGISPWVSQFSLYWQKVTEPVDSEPNEAMLWGTLLEPVIIERFEDLHPEFSVRSGDGIWCDPDRPYVRATPDALLCDLGGTDPVAVLEVKTAGDATHWADGVPPYYYCQVQQQIHVMGVDVAYVAVLIRGRDYREFEVPRDQAYIDGVLLPALDQFWARVERMDAPPVDAMDSTTATLRELHPDVEDVEVEVPDDVAEAYLLAIDLEKVRAQRKKLAVNALLNAIGDGRYATHDGRRIAVRTVSDTTRLDTKALKADDPALFDKYVRTTRVASLRALNTEGTP